jgi:hypothetical protein
MNADAGEFMQGGTHPDGKVIKGCDKSKCYMFTDTSEYKKKIAGEIKADADALKQLRDAEKDDKKKLQLHVQWMKTMTYKQLMNGREGPASAINTYDKALFTWGMGYGSTGALKQVLPKIYEIEKKKPDLNDHYVQKLFYLCGFKFEGGEYWVCDTDAKKVYHDGKAIADSEYNAYRYIHDTNELHFMWTLAARDDLTRPTMLEAQKQVFFAGNGNVALAERIQTAALYTFLAHLQHWTGDLGMDFIAYGCGPEGTPPVAPIYPSEAADSEMAIQSVHRFYRWRSPDWNQNAFSQVRDMWGQMVNLDAKEEGATGFNPVYDIMTAAPVATVPDGNLKGLRPDKTFFDLGPCSDFHRAADGTPNELPGKHGAQPSKPAPAPAPQEGDPGFIGPPSPPAPKDGDADFIGPPSAPAEDTSKPSDELPTWRFCVAAGTRVSTPDGERPIEDLREGSAVLALDMKTRAVVVARVRAAVAHAPAPCVRLHVPGVPPLDVTAEHPVFSGGAWRRAGDLGEGDELTSLGEERALHARAVARVERLAEPRVVHDLEVERAGTFFAGSILVHNKIMPW